jgi:hypothetical protein
MRFTLRIITAALLVGFAVTTAFAQSLENKKGLELNGIDPKLKSAAINGVDGPANLFDVAPYLKENLGLGTKAMFDLQFSFPVSSPGELATGVETDGQYIYASVWSNAYFYRYTLAGAFVDSFTIAGVSAIRDLAYDGQYFYGAAANNLIRQMDFTNHLLVSTITAPAAVGARHIAYDPINDAFWCGNWADNFSLVSKTGVVLNTILATAHLQTSAYGSAYDGYSAGGPYLWIFNQDGNGNNLVQISIATGAPTGVSFDVTTVVTVTIGSDIAGGCFISDQLVPNKATIGGCVQNLTIFGLELADITVAPNDISPSVLVAPTSSNVLTATEDIIVTVENLDTVAHANIPITYVIDGGTPVNDMITASIAAQGSYDFTFAVPVDMSAPGHVYDIVIYTAFPADGNISNDTLYATVTNLWDVEPISIDMPPVVGPGTVVPLATVTNNGTLTTTFDVTMEIQGGYTSTQTVTNLAPGANQQVTFANWTAAIGTYDITVYTTLLADSVHSNDTLLGSIQVMELTKAYVYVAYDPTSTLPEGPAYTFVQAPGVVTSLADQTGTNFLAGGTWGYGNKWYGAVYGDNTLVTLDTLTGARTVVGSIGKGISGLAYDYSTNKLFGVEWDGVNSNLYSINPLNGAPTLIGTCGTSLLINLACDLSGNLYAAAITDDNFYSVNKTTGVATLVGPLGFDAAYAQDMEFDLNTGLLYMAAYNAVDGGEMRIVNPATGATTLLGGFPDGSELTGFAIPYVTVLPPADAAAVSINNLQSSCNLSATEAVELTIANMGSANITSLSATFVVDGGTPVTETVTQTILPGATYDFTFTGTANLAAAGSHTIVAYVTLAGDTESWNDTTSVTVNQVSPSTVPYTMGFESTEDFSAWSIYDVNGDTYTWFYSTSGGNNAPASMQYSYNAASAANDWLITTCVQLDAAVTYNVEYFYMVQSATYPEAFEVKIGTGNTPADQTTTLATHSNLTNVAYTSGGSNFTVPANGVYYIGFHCTSAADMWILYLDDISITVSNGITEKDKDAGVKLYPNPVNDMLNVTSIAKVSKINITDMVGATVYESSEAGNDFRINTSNFAQGMYMISLETENGMVVQKFIVE